MDRDTALLTFFPSVVLSDQELIDLRKAWRKASNRQPTLPTAEAKKFLCDHFDALARTRRAVAMARLAQARSLTEQVAAARSKRACEILRTSLGVKRTRDSAAGDNGRGQITAPPRAKRVRIV